MNAARGAVCDNHALLEWQGDVALDCWENEPAISRPLLEKAFVATPHIAGYSQQGKQRGTAMIIEFKKCDSDSATAMKKMCEAAIAQIDGVGGARNQGTGHDYPAIFRQGFFRHHCVGGEECFISAGSAQGPVPQALVFDDLFLAAAGDDVDIPGGAHDAAHIHRPQILADVFVVIVFVISYPGSGNGNYGVVVSAGLQIRFQIGENAVFVGSGIKTCFRAAFDIARHIHAVLTVR